MLTHTGFKYCPKCASEKISAQTENSMICQTCGYTYFHNTAAAVGGLLVLDKKLVLLRRSHEPMKGKLDFPGGFINYNESAEEALIREVNEETGIKMDKLEYFGASSNIYKYKNVMYFTSDIFYTAEIHSVESFRPNDEVSELVLVDPGKINLDDVAFVSARKMIELFRKKH
jgi:NAD+ diphosphatase